MATMIVSLRPAAYKTSIYYTMEEVARGERSCVLIWGFTLSENSERGFTKREVTGVHKMVRLTPQGQT